MWHVATFSWNLGEARLGSLNVFNEIISSCPIFASRMGQLKVFIFHMLFCNIHHAFPICGINAAMCLHDARGVCRPWSDACMHKQDRSSQWANQWMDQALQLQASSSCTMIWCPTMSICYNPVAWTPVREAALDDPMAVHCRQRLKYLVVHQKKGLRIWPLLTNYQWDKALQIWCLIVLRVLVASARLSQQEFQIHCKESGQNFRVWSISWNSSWWDGCTRTFANKLRFDPWNRSETFIWTSYTALRRLATGISIKMALNDLRKPRCKSSVHDHDRHKYNHGVWLLYWFSKYSLDSILHEACQILVCHAFLCRQSCIRSTGCIRYDQRYSCHTLVHMVFYWRGAVIHIMLWYPSEPQ